MKYFQLLYYQRIQYNEYYVEKGVMHIGINVVFFVFFFISTFRLNYKTYYDKMKMKIILMFPKVFSVSFEYHEIKNKLQYYNMKKI